MTISLYFFLILNLIEGLSLLYAIRALQDFREDFNIKEEVILYTMVWVGFGNFIYFLYIQATYSEWLSMA